MIYDRVARSSAVRRPRQAVAEARLNLERVDGALIHDAPWRVIVDYAKKHEIDLIAMGTAGRGLVARALLGSVADKVTSCPVLTTSTPGGGRMTVGRPASFSSRRPLPLACVS